MQTADWQVLNRQIVARAQQDPAYRQMLLDNPRAALEQAFGHELPANLRVRVVEQEPDTIYLLLPPAGQASEELSEADLDAVAGGVGQPTAYTVAGGQNPTAFTVAGSQNPTAFTVAGSGERSGG
jgi:hypothetical protein